MVLGCNVVMMSACAFYFRIFVDRLWGCPSGGGHTYDAGLLLVAKPLGFLK